MKVEIEDRLFEWDDEKNEINIRKHGIDFNDAIGVFFDEFRIERYDEYHSDEEDRWKVIGMVDGVLVVIYTEEISSARIISARKATKQERRDYYGYSES